MKPQNHPSHATPVYLSAATLFDGQDPAESGHGKFTATLYNGGAVFGGAVYVDLATLTIEPSVPVLADHDPAKVIGVFSAIVNSGQNLTANGVLFLDEDGQAQSIYKKSKRGMKWQTSMGVFDYSLEDFPDGKTFQINGQTAQGPATVLRNGYLREGSIVALGADKTTSATFFHQRASSAPISQKEGATMPTQEEFNELKTELAALKVQLAEKDAALLAATTAQRTVEVKELFSAIGREFDPANAAPYIALSADSFAAIAADLKANSKPAQPATLPAHFSASAFSVGAASQPAENPLVAAMRNMGAIK